MAEKKVQVDIIGKDLASPHLLAVAANAKKLSSALVGIETGKLLGPGAGMNAWLKETGTMISDQTAQLRNAGLGLLAAGGAILGGLTLMAKGIGDYGAQIERNAEIMQISAEQYQRLKYAADQTHTPIDSVTAAVTRVTRAIGEANTGNKTYQETFARLGVSYKNADGSARSNMNVLLDLAEAYKTGKKSAVEVTAALGLLGIRGGKEMLPMLALGRKGLEDLMQSAVGVIPDATIKKLDDFHAKWAALSTELKAVLASALAPLMPAFELIAGGLQKTGEWLAKSHPGLLGFIAASTALVGILAMVGGGLLLVKAGFQGLAIIKTAVGWIGGVNTAMLSLNPTLVAGLGVVLGLVAAWAAYGEIIGWIDMKSVNDQMKQWNKNLDEVNRRWEERKKSSGKGWFSPAEEAYRKQAQQEIAKLNDQARAGGPKWSLENVVGSIKGAVNSITGIAIPGLKMPGIEGPEIPGLTPEVETGKAMQDMSKYRSAIIEMTKGETAKKLFDLDSERDKNRELFNEKKISAQDWYDFQKYYDLEHAKILQDAKDKETEIVRKYSNESARMTQGDAAYQRLLLAQEEEDLKKHYGNNKEVVDAFAAHKKATLAKIAKDEQKDLLGGLLKQLIGIDKLPAAMGLLGKGPSFSFATGSPNYSWNNSSAVNVRQYNVYISASSKEEALRKLNDAWDRGGL